MNTNIIRRVAKLTVPLLLIPWFSPSVHAEPTYFRPHVMKVIQPQAQINKAINGSLKNPHASIPHLVYYGGNVVSNTEVIQVLWGNGNYIPQVTSTGTPSIASFFQGVLNSPYIDWLTEYNTTGSGSNQSIGRGSFLGQYRITPSRSSTTVDDTFIQTEIYNQIAAGHLPRPSTDSAGHTNTYYAIFFPKGVTITEGGTASCQYFCAYHGTVAASRTINEFYYGVHPDFQAGSGCDLGCGTSTRTFDNVTSVASHELVEMITDPEVGIAGNLAAPLAWYDNTNGEIGDICNADQGTVVGSDGVTYTVQTEWSNSEAACIVSKSNTSSAPQITSAATATFTVGASNTFHVTATGTPAPTFSVTGSLPAGVTLSSTGVLSGIATTAGSYTFTITATNGTSPDATQNFTLTVQDFAISVSPSSRTVTRGQSTTYSVSVSSSSVSGSVFLSCAGGPPGTTCQIPGSVSARRGSNATATVRTGRNARRGTYNVVFKARSGSVSRYAYGTITIQ